MNKTYVLVYMYDTENGQGVESLAVSQDKALLQERMRQCAAELRRAIEESEGPDFAWEPDLTAYDEDCIHLGYEDSCLPNIWRWEIQQVDVLDTAIPKVIAVIDGGSIQNAYTDQPEQVSFNVPDLDNAAAEPDENAAEEIYRAAREAAQTMTRIY